MKEMDSISRDTHVNMDYVNASQSLQQPAFSQVRFGFGLLSNTTTSYKNLSYLPKSFCRKMNMICPWLPQDHYSSIQRTYSTTIWYRGASAVVGFAVLILSQVAILITGATGWKIAFFS